MVIVGNSISKLRDKTLSGVGWSIVSQLGAQGLRFIIGVILARLLSPEAFGLMGMILIFVGFANLFTDLGFGSALIQKQDTTPDHYFSIFWINVASGFTLMVLFIAFSPFIAQFYSQPTLIPLTILISTNFFIGSFKVIQSSLLTKQLEFRRLAFVDLTALVISGSIGIIMAILGLGVWSLACQSVISTTLGVILLWSINDWRPSLRFRLAAVKELLGFSLNLIGFNSLNYWLRNADNLLIGRFLGSSSLGIYSRSYSLMLLPLTTVSRTIGQVMFPAISSIQSDKQRVAKIYLRVTQTVALITFPMMIGLWTVSDHFVLALFGEQWVEMIPILRVFCLLGMLQSIGTLNGNLYRSQGRTDLEFKVGGIVGVLGVAAMIFGLRWGIEGIAYAYGVFNLLAVYPSINNAVALVGLTFFEVARKLTGISLCAAVMGVAVWAIGVLLPSGWSHWAYLGVQVPAGGVVYGLLTHFFKVRAYQDIRTLVLEQWQIRRVSWRLSTKESA